jgi:formylglycine-generating enzyme required for sulfatase activity
MGRRGIASVVLVRAAVFAIAAIAGACGIDALGTATGSGLDGAGDGAAGGGPGSDAGGGPGWGASDDGAAGDGAADGLPLDSGDGGANDPCAARGGPAMVRVASTPKPFCIDSTEVTNAQYEPFYAAAQTDAGSAPPFCGWNTDYRPDTWSPAAPHFPAGTEDVPVHAVDYCDAFMFCQWAGKRLCGSLDGEPAPFGEVADAQANAWTYACSAGGTRAYPYGASYVAGACNGDDPVGAIASAGAFPACAGGFPGIFDMSGNAWEWDDSCQGAGGPTTTCHVRGGSVIRTPGELACASYGETPRNDSTGNNGIRCCKY